MSLHPIIYIVLGIVVAALSAFQPQMILFVFIGIGVAIYGGIKWVFAKKPVQEEKQSVAHDKTHLHHTQHHHTTHKQHQHRTAQQYPNQHHVRPQVRYKTCPNCGKPIHAGYRFCPHCGYGV